MSKKKKKNKNTKTSKALKWIKLGLKIFILVFLIILLILGIIFYNTYGKTIFELQAQAKQIVRSSTSDTFRQTETSLVYDSNGELISVLKGEKDVYYLEYSEIPLYAKQAMIAIEDKKFMSHGGIDLKAIVRAVIELIRNKGAKTQGASTITQQLSRNIFLTMEKSYERKIKEIFIALELEKKYTKKQILEYYLNNIYFSNGYYGLEAASKGYFDKSVSELNLSQIAFLCAIPNNPTKYDPVDNKENTIKRRNRILKQMLDDGYIDQSEYDKAISKKIKLKRSEKISKKNYVETFVYFCATEALMKEQGFIFEYKFDSDEEKDDYNERYQELYNQCQQSLFTGGYRIYTSIDLEKQALLQEAVDNALAGFTSVNDEGIYLMQGAATCIDNLTGRVVAVVGGREQDTKGYTLNRAYQSYRQPGSSIKPLIVYTPLLQSIYGYTPNSMVNDQYKEGGPRNSDRVYLGNITLRTAVEKSRNTIAWQLFEELTPSVGISYLYNMDFKKIVSTDYTLAAALGGITNGVSTVEMASGYSTIENDGVYRKPTCIVKITDTEDEEIVNDYIEEKQIYEKSAARMMVDILTGVLIRGTAAGKALPNMACAGKTGTTNDKKDGWFVGFTHYYTTSVWVGYDMPRTVDNLYGSTYPLTIWYNYMSKLHEGLENIDFPKYEYVNNNVQEPENNDYTQSPDENIDDNIEDEPEKDDDFNILDGVEDEKNEDNDDNKGGILDDIKDEDDSINNNNQNDPSNGILDDLIDNNNQNNPIDDILDDPSVDNDYINEPDDDYTNEPDNDYTNEPDDDYTNEPDDDYTNEPDDDYTNEPDDDYTNEPNDISTNTIANQDTNLTNDDTMGMFGNETQDSFVTNE